MIKVLFVCMGNICRSPLAEGILQRLIDEHGLSEQLACDSAGTDAYHIGHPPDTRMQATARRYGIELAHLIARQVQGQDLVDFDYILVMDNYNLQKMQALQHMARAGQAEVLLMRQFEPDFTRPQDVPDPYYGAASGFDEVFEILSRTISRFFDFLRHKHSL